MKISGRIALLAMVMLGGCLGPEGTSQLDAEMKAVRERIAQARDERNSYGKGSVMHDLISLRIAVHEQTLAMLEQRRAAGSWRTKLAYTVDGKPWSAAAETVKKAAALERRLKQAQAGRASDLRSIKESDEAVKSLYVMSAGTKAILISQLEYQLAALEYGFPPYYVPFHPPAEGVTPPQIIEVPAGKSAIVQ